MPDANPFRDGTPFRKVIIGGTPVPGRLQSVNGVEVEQDINFQKSSGGSANASSAATPPQTGNIRVATPPPATTTGGGNTAGSFGVSVWRGAKLAEQIDIVTRITTEAEYDAAKAMLALVLPKRGQKPPTLTLEHPDANEVGINRVIIRKMRMPKEKAAGTFDYEFAISFAEYNPQKTAAAGQADPAKPPDEPTAKDGQEQELQRLLNRAKEP
jgi:hypothetical protein